MSKNGSTLSDEWRAASLGDANFATYMMDSVGAFFNDVALSVF
jgi:hypothetical protein